MIEVRVVESELKRSVRENDESDFIEGYAALYNVRSVPELGFIEIIEPGAFRDADLSDVRMLYNHNSDKLLARTTSRTLEVVADEKGLFYRGNIAGTSYGKDLMVLVDRGDVNQSSFGFGALMKGDDEWEVMADGTMVRHIKRFRKIVDTSPTPFPAYVQTRIDRRSYEGFMEANKAFIENEHRRLDMAIKALQLYQ